MDNNIFSPDWMYKKYFLGYVEFSLRPKIKLDLFFYSHEQRYIVKVRSEKGRLTTSIEKVDAFHLTKKECERFLISSDYLVPSKLAETCYKDFSADILDKIEEYDEYFPLPTSSGHEDDIYILDADAESFLPIYSEKVSDYFECDCNCHLGANFLEEIVQKDLASYPERMVKQLSGQSNEDMYVAYNTFKGKKAKLLGVSYLPSKNRQKTAVKVELYFTIDDNLYKLNRTSANWQEFFSFDKVSNLEELCSKDGGSKTQFFIYGKEIEVAEYNFINCPQDEADRCWVKGTKGKDIHVGCGIGCNSLGFLTSSVFAIELVREFNVVVLTSEMEEIKGSSYAVKRKRFLAEIGQMIEE